MLSVKVIFEFSDLGLLGDPVKQGQKLGILPTDLCSGTEETNISN